MIFLLYSCYTQGSDAAIIVNEELLNTFKVRAKQVPTFVSVWNSLGTQSQTTVSIWAPNTGKSILSSTVCIYQFLKSLLILLCFSIVSYMKSYQYFTIYIYFISLMKSYFLIFLLCHRWELVSVIMRV